MTDQTADRIPLRTVPTREDRMATDRIIEAAQDPTTAVHALDLAADLDRTRTDRDEAYAELDRVSAALNRAGINGPGNYGDRIDAAAEALARTHALEAERDDLRIQLHRAETETRSQDRAVRELEAERDQARATVTAVEREHGETLEQLTQAWAALNAAGYTHPTASVALLIAQCAADRDTALHLVELRTAALQRRARDLTAALRVVDAVRTGTLEDIDRAMAAYDAPGDLAGPTNARRQTAAERPDSAGEGTDKGDAATEAHRGAEGGDAGWLDDALETADSVLIDNRDRIWRTAPHGTYHRHPFGNRTRASLDAQYGPTQTAMVIYLDGPGHVCDPIECACELSPTDAPPPGSGPDRVQGVGEPTEVRVLSALESLGWPDDRNDGSDTPGAAWEAVRDAIAAADLAAPSGSQPIRPADWEQRAVDAARDALAAAWPNLGAGAVAEVAVRAIIDASLAGPGGRCPACGSTYPRTVPAGEDQRCPTCSSEPTPAERAEHAPTVTAVLADVRAGRPTQREG